MFGFLKKIFGSAQDRQIRKYAKLVAQVNQWDEKFQSLSDEELRHKTVEFRERLQKGETLDQLLPEAYAVVKGCCRRLRGTEIHVSGYNQQWDMVPFDVQIIGGIALHQGCIAEMQTGEGKTITAVMPLYLNALSGKPVHLVTVNDYLAQRDCEWVGTVLRWLGMTTGALTNGTSQEDRREVYLADVVYGTASEFGFDYLRDNSMVIRKADQVQRGYYFAIVDEVDSILIDEARTPLIISGPVPVSRQMYDELKGGVAELVRRQRDFCNRLASEARKYLEKPDQPEGQAVEPQPKKDKAQREREEEAVRKLWLVGKGTPNNKILKRLKEDPDIRADLDKLDLYFYSDTNKEERARVLAELYMIVDEKANEFELNDKGIQAWHDVTGGSTNDFVMLDISHEYLKIDEDPNLDEAAKLQAKLAVQEEDAKRKERAHNLRQLLRAHLLMEKDVDYMISDGKIVIIDENTGRPQPGRRFSDGLHQAIEAKEGVLIQKETQTYATITLQNYFRMYEKLAGMTGTAGTEANEFKQIYKMEVLEIPTHRPCVRKEFNDEIYMTEREKYNAILKEVREVHEQGRPILIGTESVEISEKLSRIFKQNKLEHVVLNAKQNDKEAEIVANAGRRGAITISTNMAGRGTDIKLEKGIADIGGLYVVGTTRHQSRRIDRQLRGRSARQGDPGSAKFYVSFEDSLLRLFASPRMTAVLQRFRPPEGEPISAGILNKSIETAQKRIEQRNYVIRKHTLEYDDVMNKQRQEIYAFRNDIIRLEDVEPLAIELLESVCSSAADQFFKSRAQEGGWDPEGYRQWLMRHFPVTFEEGYFDQEYMDITELEKLAADKIVKAFKEKLERENQKVLASSAEIGQVIPRKPSNEAVRSLMIRKTDQLWQEHLLVMDHLRSDVNLRTVGQRDPLTEFKHESFNLFEQFSRTLRTEIGQDLFRFEMVVRQRPTLEQLLSVLRMETNRSLVSDLENPSDQLPPNESPQPDSQQEVGEEKLEPIVAGPKVGRNDLCPCGSGKKYKKCCGLSKEDAGAD
jgi:preprotein translocase subunit SecA